MAARGIRPLPRCDDLDVRRWLRARGSEGDREVGRVSSTRRKLGRHQKTKVRYGGGSPGARAPSQLLRGCGGSKTRAGMQRRRQTIGGKGERGHGKIKRRRERWTYLRRSHRWTQLHGVTVRRDCERESRSMAPVEGVVTAEDKRQMRRAQRRVGINPEKEGLPWVNLPNRVCQCYIGRTMAQAHTPGRGVDWTPPMQRGRKGGEGRFRGVLKALCLRMNGQVRSMFVKRGTC